MAGEQTDLEAVFNNNAKKLYQFYYYRVLDKQRAEDLTSETFIALASSKGKIPTEQKAAVRYLFGIAKNIWNQYLREKYKDLEYGVENIEDFSQYVDDTIQYAENSSLKDRAMKYINKLPQKQYVIAKRRLIEGKTVKEISEELNKPANYVKVTLRRSMRSLEKLVSIDEPNPGASNE